ncbi:MAG: cytochrome c [Caldilineaceae bacterium]|nr:cytochrome c [Caldilineaceae bacterium]
MLFLLLGMFLLAGCSTLSMKEQPKLAEPYADSPVFGTAARNILPEAVAVSDVRGDEYFYRGTENGEPVDAVPFEVTMDVLERGQSLYNAFCTPCHGFVGNGDGAVALEGIAGEGNVPPASFHNEDLAAQPIGYYVQVMTEGKGMMYSYAGRIEPADRWAVAAYVRALQLSQKAAFDAMPADVQEQISAVQ